MKIFNVYILICNLHLRVSNVCIYADMPEELQFVMKKIKPELVNLTELLPLLNGNDLLTLDENYILQNHLTSPIERISFLLYSIIPRKGIEACRKFIMCLKQETNHAGHQELAKQFKAMKVSICKHCVLCCTLDSNLS